ncbi:MAG: hypothetical protein HY816_17985 [Candidatus Wallbacteria bacterium]|nr:hypothetical protein [Candidatus Wallbacteria bacterium]
MRLFVAASFAYIGLFVLVQTVRQWRRLGVVPIASLTNRSHLQARKLVEDTVGLGLAFWGAFMALYVYDPAWWRGLPHAWGGRIACDAAAVVCLFASAAMLTAGNLTMGRSWLMGIADQPQPLVSHGIYRHVRHPIYGAMLLYFGSAALLMPNLLTVPAMLLAMYAITVEAALEEDYWCQHEPVAYPALMARTGKFFPRVWYLGIQLGAPPPDPGQGVRGRSP